MCKRTGSSQQEKEHDRSTESENIPLVLQPWVCMYRNTPNIISICGVGLTFSVMSALYLFVWRMASLHTLFWFGWPRWPDDMLTQKAVGSAIAIIHSLHLELPLLNCLLTQPFVPCERLDSSPKWWQDSTHALLEFCTGYMMHDAFFVAYRAYEAGVDLSNSDILFIGHHIACSSYMTSARIIGAGHLSAMILMYTGEFTNPFQNTSAILEHALGTECCGGATTQMWYEYAEFVFSILYFFFRVFVGPICALYATYDLLLTQKGRQNVPLGLGLFWTVASWGVLIGSIPWIVDAYYSILKFTNMNVAQPQEL